MAVSASRDALQLTGNLAFGAGGVDVKHLIGSFIKTVHFTRDNDYIVIFQNSSGVEDNIILPPGWLIAAIEPTNPSPYKGMGWYDTISNSLKIHDGSSFVVLTGGTLLADGSVTTVKIKDDAVTPAKLDADNATKQDAFLLRLNALRRDLNNIATLTIAEQRTLLLSLGSLIDGPRPAPSAAYSGRTWIDDHNDRSYVCRNRQEVSTAVGGLWSDASTTTAGIEIAENVADLEDPANPVSSDYAYTYSDNKWWRGAVLNSRNVWRETQPITALSGRLTVTQGWTTVWLGKHRWDYNATQQLPHSALPANTDYYFYNTRTVTIRKFTRADYSAAGTVSDHWQWESLVATAAEIDIIEARDGNLPPLANDGTDDRQIAIANDGIHFVQLIPEAATPATVGTWTAYDYSKTNPYRKYIGVISTDDPSGSTVGDFYYNSTWHRWRIYRPAGNWAWFNDHWEDLSDEDSAWPVRFVGHHGSRAEALAYAASSGITTGQTFVAFTGSQIETGSQFFQGNSARFSRRWRFLPLNQPTSTSTLFLDDVYSMPGGPSEAVDIESGRNGRFYKTVYGLDHGVRFNAITLQGKAPATFATYRLRLLKGVNPSPPNETVITGGDLLWPLTPLQLVESANVESTDLFSRKFTFPTISLNRGEYLVVEWGRPYGGDERCFVRVVRDLTEHHSFSAFRFIGSGTDGLDEDGNRNIDNVEWTNAGLWIEIEYAIEYDVNAAVAAHGNDDFTQSGAFSLVDDNLSLQLTRELGGQVDVPIIDLSGVGLASPAFTGTPTAPTPVTLSSDTQIATKKYVDDNAGAGLADDSVTTVKIKDDAVTNAKMADNAISTAEIADDSVNPDKLIADSIDQKTEMRTRIAAAAIDSPALTGAPTAPTPVTAGGNTQIATKKYVDDAAVGGNAGLVRGPLLAQVTLPTTSRVVGQAVFTSSELAWSIPAGVTGVTASALDILNLDAIPDNVGDAAIGIFVCVTVGTDEILCELFPWLQSTSSTSGSSSWRTKANLFIAVELGKSAIVGNAYWYMQLQSLVGGTAVQSYDADTKVNVYLARAAGPAGPVGPEGSVSAAQLDTEVAERKRVDVAEAVVRGNADTDLGTRITNENTGRTEGDTDEATARANEDTALSGRITATRAVADAGVLAVTNETTAREVADTALGVRIDGLGGGGGLTETTLFDGKVRGSTTSVLRSLNNAATPAYTDEVVVPETGDLLFTAYIASNGSYAGHFQIPAKEFITRNGTPGTTSGQGQSTGFSFPVGQNRAITVTHRTVGSTKRFLWSSSHNVSTDWRLEIIHLTPAPPGPEEPSYKPGPALFRFIGLDRDAAVAAREKYFAGVVSISQAYVNIFNAGMTSYIQVTLQPPPIEQVGAAGNAWNLVLGTDHTNTSVTISPNTPGKTFTLRLPDAGITLDALAADLDSNSRLNAQVVGDGNALVDYTATWGANPTVGSVSPFSHGGDQIITERTAWRAEYIANPNFVLVLDYGILEEYQHWAVAVAPAVSDWETVFTLIKPPVSDYSPGLTPNTFRGANRAEALAALDEYVDGVSLITQASLRIYSDADNYITVSLNAVVAVGPKGNKWSLRWGGDSSSAGEIDLNTVDSLFRATLKWDSNNSTLADLHAEFSRDSKFSSVVTGDDASVASITETFGSDVIGNTVFFTGGLRTHTDTHVWFSHYADNPAATVTLEYESRQEMQVWDAALVNFRTVFTLLDSPTKPNPFTVLTHPSDIPTEDWQWTLGVELTEDQLIGRAGGTVMAPTTKDIRPLVPVNSTEVHFRFIDHTSTYRDQVYIAALILPSGNKVAGMNASFALGADLFHLRISDVGAVYLKRATTGTTTVLCDIWYR